MPTPDVLHMQSFSVSNTDDTPTTLNHLSRTQMVVQELLVSYTLWGMSGRHALASGFDHHFSSDSSSEVISTRTPLTRVILQSKHSPAPMGDSYAPFGPQRLCPDYNHNLESYFTPKDGGSIESR